MKRINRADFLALPAGTFYFKAGDRTLAIKCETVAGKDWYAMEINQIEPPDADGCDWSDAVERAEQAMLSGASMPLIDTMTRDGLFDADETFFVFEAADLLALRNKVDMALSTST